MADIKDNPGGIAPKDTSPVVGVPGGQQGQQGQGQQGQKKAEVYDYTYFSSLPEGMPVELIDGQVFSRLPIIVIKKSAHLYSVNWRIILRTKKPKYSLRRMMFFL